MPEVFQVSECRQMRKSSNLYPGNTWKNYWNSVGFACLESLQRSHEVKEALEISIGPKKIKMTRADL
jgi:hypothetical protein